MKLQFENRVYDILKWLCLIALPAASVLYSALAGDVKVPGVGTYYKDCTASSDDGILFTIYDGATNYVCLANTVTKEIIPNVGDPSDKKHVEYMCSYGEAFLKAYLH